MSVLAAERTRIAGRFVLEAIAGAGGMGTVHRARDEQSGQIVALKLIQPHGRLNEVERFVREADLLSALRHPGIVGYVAHGVTEADEPYLAMEWLEGEDLAQRLGRGPLSLDESLTLLRRTAEALAVAHARGVVHRDLKPSNLFLRGGDVGRLAVLDFGIARLAAISKMMTGTGMIMGTPGYMAPEQARGEREVTAAADVFSLGCVLFECLTGQSPFAADHMMAVLARILFDEPHRLRAVRPDMPASLEGLLGSMLVKDTARRLPDARAVLAALDALDDVTPETGPPLLRQSGEQQLLSVLMALPPDGAGEPHGAEDSTLSGDQLMQLQRELAEQGARLEVLADGSLVATVLHGRGAATDEAARAARCALSIKTRWPHAMIALGTGRGREGERTPVGEVFDRAAALLREHGRSSPSEQILLDEVTRGLLEVRFVVRQTPSGAFALTGEELALDASRPLLGKPTPCVGRDTELAALESALAGGIEEREPRAVLVTAPAGAGKSRLLHEFLRRVRARGEDVLVLFGRGDPLTVGSPYGLLGQAVRRLCGVLDGESLPVRREKLAARVGERVPAAERDRVVAFIGELAGAPFPDAHSVKLRAARQDPHLMSDHVTQAVLDLLRAEGEARPVLLVLEDLHWGDTLTVQVGGAALRKLRDCPLMVLGLARPEVHELVQRLWSGTAQVLPLRPLGKKAGERLVQQALGKQVPPDVVARILAQSEGNALFLEELIRAAAEGHGDEAPETVLAMLQARIGRLPPGARRVLRAASVLGDTAWRGGLGALLGSSMSDQEIDGWVARLSQDEILEELLESRFPGERELRLRHALMREAAYGLLTEEDRAQWHRLAARYLEAVGESDARVLAEHYREGREPERAVHHFLQAADQSYETNDMAATLASVERGLACGAQGEMRGALLDLLITVHLGQERHGDVVTLGLEALALLPEGSRRWCHAAENVFPASVVSQQIPLLMELSSRFARVEPADDARPAYVRAATWMSVTLALISARDAANLFLSRVQQVCDRIDPGDTLTWAFRWSCESDAHHLLEERPWSARREHALARDAYRAAGERRYQSIIGAFLGKALMDLGAHEEAEAELRANLAIAEQLSEPLSITYARTYLSRLLAARAPLDRLDEAARLAAEVITSPNQTLVGWAHGTLAVIAQRRGDLAGAEAEARVACEATRPFPANAWDMIALLSRVQLARGRAAEALATSEEGVRELGRLGMAGFGELELRLSLAEAQHALGQHEAARATLADLLPRFRERLDDIPEPAARERYLTRVPTSARIVALAEEWLGRGAVAGAGAGAA
jgi:hypothetical protein